MSQYSGKVSRGGDAEASRTSHKQMSENCVLSAPTASCCFSTSVTATLHNTDRAVRGEMLHREEAGDPRRLR